VCCSLLQCVAMCCNIILLHSRSIDTLIKGLNTSVLQCVAVCCSVLQCVVVCCSVLQCVAVCCSVLQYHTVAFAILWHANKRKGRKITLEILSGCGWIWTFNSFDVFCCILISYIILNTSDVRWIHLIYGCRMNFEFIMCFFVLWHRGA